MMTLPRAEPGVVEGNPVREDIEESARMAGMDYIVNVVLNENKGIVQAVAGTSSKPIGRRSRPMT